MKPGVGPPPERVNLAELVGDKGLVVFMRHVRYNFFFLCLVLFLTTRNRSKQEDHSSCFERFQIQQAHASTCRAPPCLAQVN